MGLGGWELEEGKNTGRERGGGEGEGTKVYVVRWERMPSGVSRGG